MGLHIIAEALARIEHKLDALMRHQKLPAPAPMHFLGNVCPACNVAVEYQVDLQHNVVVRKCQCSTGKHVSTIPLFPGPIKVQGEANGRASNPVAAEDSSERETRKPGNR